MDLTSHETIEFAKLNAGVVQPSKTSINPYYLGLQVFKDIEERYNNPDEELIRQGVKPGSVKKCLKSVNWNQICRSSETT
jgi:stage V sporulation protein R